MASSKKLRAKLEAARVNQTLVATRRKPKFAIGHVDGFVLHVGRRWAVLAKVADGGWFDGFFAFQLSDLRSVKKDRSVSSAFARSRPEWPPVSPFEPNSFDDVADVLKAFAAHGQLIGIEKERERSAMWIGVMEDLWPKWVWLQQVDPQAIWAEKPLGYKLKSITTVLTGDRYMQALHQVAGPAPIFQNPELLS